MTIQSTTLTGFTAILHLNSLFSITYVVLSSSSHFIPYSRNPSPDTAFSNIGRIVSMNNCLRYSVFPSYMNLRETATTYFSSHRSKRLTLTLSSAVCCI
jgi:hypothetical protein